VIDFGVASAIEFATGLTMTRRQPGTPAFMAPEQHEGKKATAAADVFAWGGVIAFAGTGRLPFGLGSEASVAYRVVYAQPDLDGLDERLRGLVGAAMAKDPGVRPGATDLLGALVGGTGPAEAAAAVASGAWGWPAGGLAPAGTGPGRRPWDRGRRRGPGLAAALGIGAGAGLPAALALWLLASLAAWRLGARPWLGALAVAGPVVAALAVLALRRGWLRAAAIPALVLVTLAGGLAAAGPTRSRLGRPAPAAPVQAAPVDFGSGDPVVLRDDFSGRAGAWATPSARSFQVAYGGGALRLATRSNFEVLTAPAAARRPLARARVRFDVTHTGGTASGAVTVHCRDNQFGDFYVVDLEMDGDFRVQKYISGDGPGNMPVIDEQLRRGKVRMKAGAPNRVEVACAGSAGAAGVLLVVNGAEAARVEDRAWPVQGPGRVTLGAYSPEVIGGTTPWVRLAVDNVTVWGRPG
jgi:hypothetical protein